MDGWRSGSGRVDHLRHALIVPRVIAPHGNAGQGVEISPDQAVAMLMQARLRELGSFARNWPRVPKMDDASNSVDWKWRFAGAVYLRVTESQIDPLLDCSRDAGTPEHRAAAAAAAASALIEVDRSEEAIDLVTPLIDRDECASIDQNWLILQRARPLLRSDTPLPRSPTRRRRRPLDRSRHLTRRPVR